VGGLGGVRGAGGVGGPGGGEAGFRGAGSGGGAGGRPWVGARPAGVRAAEGLGRGAMDGSGRRRGEEAGGGAVPREHETLDPRCPDRVREPRSGGGRGARTGGG